MMMQYTLVMRMSSSDCTALGTFDGFVRKIGFLPLFVFTHPFHKSLCDCKCALHIYMPVTEPHETVVAHNNATWTLGLVCVT